MPNAYRYPAIDRIDAVSTDDEVIKWMPMKGQLMLIKRQSIVKKSSWTLSRGDGMASSRHTTGAKIYKTVATSSRSGSST
jgi:hypothetical protein